MAAALDALHLGLDFFGEAFRHLAQPDGLAVAFLVDEEDPPASAGIVGDARHDVVPFSEQPAGGARF
jgi:hypothetical protein